MARAPLTLASVALGAGIASGVQRPVPSGGGPLLLALLLAGAVLVVVGRLRSHAWAPLAALALAGGALGVTTRAGADRACAARLPDQTPLEVRAEVVAVVGGRLELRVADVRIGDHAIRCDAVLVGRWRGAEPPRGATATVEGQWWRPPGRPSLLRAPGLLLVERLDVSGEATPGAGPVRRLLDATRHRADAVRGAAADRLAALYGDRAPLAASLLLARRDGLDPEVRDRFARAGLSHLLAISGLHVALVAGILVMLLGALRVPRAWGPWVAGTATCAYVLFLGAPSSAVRAAIQIVLVLVARGLQRPARTESLIAAAAFVLLAWEPGALLAPGFQLSFAGVAGILALRRPLLRLGAPLDGWRPAGVRAGHWLADGLATSVAATVATAPIVAWHFGRVAPIGIVANLAAIPLLAAAVPALGLSLLLGAQVAPAGWFLAGAGGLLLAALDRTAAVAAGVPFGTVAVPPVAALALTAAVAAGWAASRRLGRVRVPVRGAVWVAVAGSVWLVAPLRPGGDAVEVHVIDVGQGDAIAIRSPGARWLLVDAGLAANGYDAGERRVVPYLGRHGVTRLEGLVLTHPDADHIGGAAAVVAALHPRWIGDPGAVVGKAGYLDLLRSADRTHTRWIGLREGLSVELDGMRVEFLNPSVVPGLVEDANDVSVVLRVEYGEFSALLTGDAPAAVEERLVARYGAGLEAEVLKVGHHGSSTSTSADLLAAATPRIALISAGRGNRYGHPHRTVLDRLAARGVQVHRTDREGSVVVRGDAAGRIRVTAERGGGR